MVHVMSEVKNPIFEYADQYRAEARRGQKLADIWLQLGTDLERNIAPLWDAQRLRADTAEARVESDQGVMQANLDEIVRLQGKLAAAEQRIAELKGSLENLLDAYSRPDDRICCSGADCGCMGATNHQQAEHYAKEAIARTALNHKPEAESHE